MWRRKTTPDGRCSQPLRCATAPYPRSSAAAQRRVPLGVHTGPVVVGPLAYEPQRPYIASGDTLRSWRHGSASAARNAVSADHALVQAAQGTRRRPARAMQRLPRWWGMSCTASSRWRAGVHGAGASHEFPLAGRARELALLHERLAAAGQGQVIGMAGEPRHGQVPAAAGVRPQSNGQSVTYCEGHCLAYGSATSYLPVRDLLR